MLENTEWDNQKRTSQRNPNDLSAQYGRDANFPVVNAL